MADFNGDQSKCQKPTVEAAELNDDLILEIVKRLPLKYAVQCSVLNKNIRRRIFKPNFLPAYSTIFSYDCYPNCWIQSFWQGIESTSTTVHPLGRSVPVNEEFSILASCNGLLLIRFYSPYSDYIFNPITSEIKPAAESSPFKFATVEEFREAERKYLKFKVGDGYSMTSTYRVVLNRSFGLMMDRPVYAHGSLYWLGDSGRATVVFDVKKEEARFIDGPIEGNDDGLARHDTCSRWFGFTDGSVHFVYVLPSEIVICRHDHVKGEWRVKVRIPNKRNLSKDNGSKLSGVFFDGRRVLFLVRECPTRVRVDRYDVESDVWENVGLVDSEIKIFCRYQWSLFSYTSTFEKVSDIYFNEKNTDLWENEGRRNVLLGLQQLLRPPEN